MKIIIEDGVCGLRLYIPMPALHVVGLLQRKHNHLLDIYQNTWSFLSKIICGTYKRGVVQVSREEVVHLGRYVHVCYCSLTCVGRQMVYLASGWKEVQTRSILSQVVRHFV